MADPRLPGTRFNHAYRIVPWAAPAPAVAGPGGPAGGLSVADPRYANWHPGASSTKLRVTPWDAAGGTVTGSQQVASGALSVADPRGAPGRHVNGMYRVSAFGEPASTVIAGSTTGNGAFAVADPRPACLNRDGRKGYATQGHYGVMDWRATAGAVPAYAKYDRGRWAVADPRPAEGEASHALPAADDRLVAVIRALDGTWHRPFTTLELAALQSLVDPEEVLELDGLSDSAWRERIGNAVPPDAAMAIGSVMGRTLLLAWSGETFMLSSEPIWVRPVAVALATDIFSNL